MSISYLIPFYLLGFPLLVSLVVSIELERRTMSKPNNPKFPHDAKDAFLDATKEFDTIEEKRKIYIRKMKSLLRERMVENMVNYRNSKMYSRPLFIAKTGGVTTPSRLARNYQDRMHYFKQEFQDIALWTKKIDAEFKDELLYESSIHATEIFDDDCIFAHENDAAFGIHEFLCVD